MPGTDPLAEAERLATICNACRYCEGLCAVFPALELRRTFGAGDLTYLANLCHDCGACHAACQFAPPHEFAVNLPDALARLRADSYRRHAWPAAFRPLFERNGVAVAAAAAASVAAFLLGFVLWHDPAALFSAGGEFYRLLPHGAMVALFGTAFLYALLAMGMGLRDFWRGIDGGALRLDGGSLARALRDAATLRQLDGGGGGCDGGEGGAAGRRRLFHHLTFYGFLLCFAATCAGTVYHYLLDLPAPYAWYQLPKLLGIAGGIGLLLGPPGLLHAKLVRDRAIHGPVRFGMDTAFLAMLFLTGATGLLLMLLRQTPAMGIALAVHLGLVFALFLTLPYGKFVHGIYRFAALALHARERRAGRAASAQPSPAPIVDESA